MAIDKMMVIVQLPACWGGGGGEEALPSVVGDCAQDTTEPSPSPLPLIPCPQQVMEYVTTVERRKIAVHCHAGLGRTGLAIACFFVFTGLHDAAAAVNFTRQYRPGSLQTQAQV